MTVRATTRRTRHGFGRRGITIFEVLVAFVVLQTGLLISLQALLAGKAFGVQARKSTYATLAAQAQVEYLVREVGAGRLTAPHMLAPAPLPLPPHLTAVEVPELLWAGTVAPTDAPGLYEIAVEVSYYGMGRHRRSVTLATRTYAGPR